MGVAGAAAVVVVVFLVGCGGGGSALTKAEYVEKADAICQKAQDDAAAYLAEAGIEDFDDPSAEELKKAMADLLSIVATRDEEISELGLPEEEPERAQVEAVAQAFEEAASESEGGIPEGPLEPKVEALNEQAREFGFQVCGGG